MSARPGQIKDIIAVNENGHIRNSVDFTYYKKKIYDYLFEGADEEQEYEAEYVI
jgi:hypothetical protein